MPQTNESRLIPVCVGVGRGFPGGDAGGAWELNYTHVQYRRLVGSGQRGKASSFGHNSKLNKHLQLGESSAMAGYGIRFFGQRGGPYRGREDD